MYYAGIGSRSTPPDILDLMERIADCMADDGFTLRSGHAPGADQAFERGCQGKAQIFLPWPDFEAGVDPPKGSKVFPRPCNQAFGIASAFHPRWLGLSQGARKLQARNSHQILGWSLTDPVSCVICWTPRGERVGGTGQALRLAAAYEIPITNLAHEAEQARAYEWVL